MQKIRSMTGFASLRRNLSTGTLSLDLKSVNNRYFEANFKLPEAYKYLEGQLRERLKRAVQRGKFELIFSFTPSCGQSLHLNEAVLGDVCAALRHIQQLLPDGRCDLTQVLLCPGVISENSSTREAQDEEILQCFDELTASLIANREGEGDRLRGFILEKIAAMEEVLRPVKAQLNDLVSQERCKLRERLQAMAVEVEESRLEQEVALLAQKADIAEEYDRLCSHISEVRRILQEGGACGKRLDFMMQEFNREANTLASKASNLSLTKIAVELKVLTEQMREQVQNIE